MGKRLQSLFVALFLILWTVPALATFTPISSPDSIYLGQTNYINFSSTPDSSSPTYSSLNSINDGILKVDFGSPMYKLTVPSTWATWSISPDSQRQSSLEELPVLRTDTIDPNPNNLPVTYIQSITMTLLSPVYIFGFEAEPDIYDVYSMTASFYNGVNLLDTIVRNVGGNQGSRLFAASSTNPITSVQFTIQETYTGEGKSPFAVGAFRYSVPEPATMLLLGSGLIGLIGFRRKFRA